ncbi:hypothetical protein VFDL14_22635 [Vibrio fortis]|uniref:Uncharacterized protein n=1 Tax=Vibrio fortis TaxID=212667 RepID=A0A066UPA7_9VIBR|nr:hypothetical protein VFDL14_22635 [Vibrio fortis]
MKSATTASIEIPSPATRIPVWPVALNCASTFRSFNAFSKARAVNIFPTEQSVPTVRRRLPWRALPVPTARGAS